jgi:uncharacterized protein (DUF1919 family)
MLRRIKSSAHRRFGGLRTASERGQLRDQVRKLDSEGISIVSNNCLAGILYELAELPKQSPTAGLYFWGLAYAQFLEDLAAGSLGRWEEFEAANLERKQSQNCWALPVSGGGELVFLHYPDAADAVTKWRRRIERLRGRTLLLISSTTDGITLDSLRKPLEHFRYTFTVEGEPAPPADDLILNSIFLHDLSDYLSLILAGQPIEQPGPIRRYD